MPSDSCPPHERLITYVRGTLPEDLAEHIDEHLDTCVTCEMTVDELERQSDPLVDSLRRPTAQDEYQRESQCKQAVAMAEAIADSLCDSVAFSVKASRPEQSDLGGIREYQLQEKLGEGGMGTVYKAHHTKLKRVEALKVLPPERMQDDRAVARFEREMAAVGKLDHPNIVRALNAGEFEGKHYLVMEYVEGIDLSKLVRRCGPLSIADACELIRQAAVGLQHAHEHGLVHRDIKPSNLMLAISGQQSAVGDEEPTCESPVASRQSAIVKILDLGLALLRGDAGEATSELTADGQLMGTLDYAPPEQISDSHDVDIRADIYSLGATLYKLLCGHAPFAGGEYDTPVRKRRAIAAGAVPPIRERRPEVPKGLVAVLERMLAWETDERFDTPGEVAEAMSAFTGGCDLTALLARADSCEVSPRQEVERAKTEPSRRPDGRSATRSTRLRFAALCAAALVTFLTVGAVVVRVWKHGKVVANPDSLPAPVRLEIEPEPLEVADGAALSKTALVPEPATIPGVRSWTIETRGHRGPVYCAEFSPDGSLLATACDDGAVRLWDWKTGTLVKALVRHDGAVRCLAWSPLGSYLASGGADWTVCVWEVESGQVVRTLRGHSGEVVSMDWSRLGLLASGGKDLENFAVRIWDVVSNDAPTELLGFNGGVDSVRWSPDGKRLAYGGGAVSLWDVESGAMSCLQPRHPGGIEAIAWSPRGDALAGSVWDTKERKFSMNFWNTNSRKTRNVADMKNGDVCVRWSPDGNTVIGGGNNSWILHVYDGLTGEFRDNWTEGDDPDRRVPEVTAIAFSPNDGAARAVCDRGGEVRIFEGSSRQSIRSLPYHVGSITSLAFSPDRRMLASGTKRHGHVRIWDVASGDCVDEWPAGDPCEEVRELVWAQDGQTLSAVFEQKTRGPWSVPARPPREHPLEEGSLGRLVATRGESAITLRNDDTGQILGTLLCLRNRQCAIVSPGGHCRCSTPEAESELVYVVQTEKGQETLGPDEFGEKYGWSNDPKRVEEHWAGAEHKRQ